MNKLIPVPVLFLFALLSFSCASGNKDGEFILEENSQNGTYSFTLDITDSCRARNIEFYTRSFKEELPQIPLVVRWVSPSGQTFSDTVYMKGTAEGIAKETYMKNVIPFELGEWTLEVSPQVEEKVLSGFGVLY